MRASLSLMFVLVLLAHLAATAAAEQVEDLDAAWRTYRQQNSEAQPAFRFPHTTCFRVAALEHGLPETLLLAVARGESDFDASARSRANAHGVMQILWPDTARHLGIHRLSELYEPCTNIDAGARYLREMLERYDGNLHLALAAYNYGPQRIAMDGRNLPQGAAWYSGYIYRHLDYVLGRSSPPSRGPDSLYSDLGQSTLVSFAAPYRAAAFVARLERQAPGLSLDWFRRGTGNFEVVMTYADRAEFDQAASQLQSAGFRLAP